MSARILVAEDNQDLRDLLQELLEDEGHSVITAADGREAMAQIDRFNQVIDLVVTDVQMPGLSGAQLLAAVRESRGETPVIVITAFGSVEQAVELVKAGAFQYLTKPLSNRDLLAAVEDALAHSAPQREQARLRRAPTQPPERIIGASRPMQMLFEQIGVAARNLSTVLITGESGTGKELVARAIHQMAGQATGRSGEFIPVNCAAIPAELIESELFGHMGGSFTGAKQARAGLFEAADGGTIFLDEIAELPAALQPKLLRALQDAVVRRVGANIERKVDVRVVAATNRDLEVEVKQGRFREDLFWRLNVIQLRTPPLRERPLDIPLLAEHFVSKYCRATDRPPLEIGAEALAVLTAYSWPGNVRELENALERAAAFSPGAVITTEFLPERIRSTGTVAAVIARASEKMLTAREIEREYILEILRRTDGNKKRAAEILGFDRKTLYRKLDEYRAEGVLE